MKDSKSDERRNNYWLSLNKGGDDSVRSGDKNDFGENQKEVTTSANSCTESVEQVHERYGIVP